MINRYKDEWYVSLHNITQTVHKTTGWFYRLSHPDLGQKILIESESPKQRIYYRLNAVVDALMKSVMMGDIKSYDLLVELRKEAKLNQIEISLDELEIYDLRHYFLMWYKELEKPVILQRDQARQMFNQYVNIITGKHFDLNRNFFAVILKDAATKGSVNIIKRVRKINESSMRVYIIR